MNTANDPFDQADFDRFRADPKKQALVQRILDRLDAPATQRPARPGEKCKCGRPAVVVYMTERFGEVGYCGIPDGGQS